MPQRQDGKSLDPTSSQSARTTRAPAAESTETRQVLMHRVIALNGVPEAAAASQPKPGKNEADVDLSRTVHEWGFHPPAELAESTVSTSQSQPAHNSKAPPEAHWATHSSISLEAFEEAPLPPRILNANIEDAVTQQYDPATTGRAMALGSSISDLASLDRALESAGVLDDDDFGVITNYQPTTTPARAPVQAQPQPQPQAQPPQPQAQQLQPKPQQPRMLLVPASIVWTVLTVFSLCALALTVLIIAVVLRVQLF